MSKPKNDVRILFFYHQKDKILCEKVIDYVRSLEQGIKASLTLLHDQRIQAGQDWKEEFELYAADADIILLLISSSYLSDSFYSNNTRLFLQRQEKKKVRVIPIILHPVPLEGSPIGQLRVLPTTGKAISDASWKSQNAALNDVSLGLKEVIRQFLKEQGIEGDDEDEAEANDIPFSSTAFNRTDTIAPCAYLTFSGRDQEGSVSRIWYLRKIMSIFSEHKKAAFDSLSEQEVYEKVQRADDSEYTLQACQRDLKYLEDHFNLVRVDDMTSIANSIPTFELLLKKKFYQATSDGIEIERLIDNRMLSHRSRLSKHDLYDVRKKLQDVNKYHEKVDLTQDDFDDLAELWNSLFKLWDKLVTESGDYFNELTKNAQYTQTDFEKFIEYKNTVTRYIQRFASVLQDVSHEINELFISWSPQKELLIRRIAEGEQRKDPTLENKPSLETTIELVRDQMTRLETWFKERSHVFYGRAVSEIHRLVNRATAFALYGRSRVNNVTVLRELAYRFLQETSVEVAQRLFDVSFAQTLPLHLSENFAGCAQIHERLEETASVWDEEPAMRVLLVPTKIKNGETNTRKQEAPMPDDRQARFILQEEELRKEHERQWCFAQLFAQHIIDLAHLSPIDRETRVILEEVIDSCLSHPSHIYHDETENKILLLNHDEQTYIHLHASDGTLFLPRYRLQRQSV